MNRLRMEFRGRSARFLTFALVALAGGCTALRRPPPAVDRSHDAEILQEVRARLASEPALDATSMRVEVDGGVVILYGSVPGIEGWNCAIRTAGLVPNVVTVVDYLQIEQGPREIMCLAPAADSPATEELPTDFPAAGAPAIDVPE